uniref:Uncharacterized protein n=1 Tax=Anthurium amnicola TaxID=1678845 RepID=A0A1D1XEU4_9ARAE
MAAAEARAAWQRMANRCFVQEDAKRAPKLACCPSSSSKLQPDLGSGAAANGSDQPASSFVPRDWNPMDFNLPPDTKWWLHMQPNFGYQTDIAHEQLSTSEEVEFGAEETVIPTSKVFEDPTPIATTCVASEKKTCALESPLMLSTNFLKHETEARAEELMTPNNDFQQQNKLNADLGENWYQDGDLMDWKAFDRLISKKSEKACFDLETPSTGSEKTEPWWRIANKDELASLVAQKSLEHFENCDLPRPQRVHFCGNPCGRLEGFDDHRLFVSSLDHRLYAGTCSPVNYANNCSTSVNMDGGCRASDARHSVYNSVETYSGMRTYNMRRRVNNPPESKHHSEFDSAKAELLEALHHSQNRAREADMAAKQAHFEKEHIIKLFFKQASHLFGYKQWIRMLQLESLFLQLKVKEHQIASLIPVFPRMPPKGRHFGSSGHKAKKRKGEKHQKCNICRYAVALAVGLGLVSAGFLFGWTLGWLLPIF